MHAAAAVAAEEEEGERAREDHCECAEDDGDDGSRVELVLIRRRGRWAAWSCDSRG